MSREQALSMMAVALMAIIALIAVGFEDATPTLAYQLIIASIGTVVVRHIISSMVP